MLSMHTLFGFLLLISTVLACDQDWECGNPLYFDCDYQQPVCSILNGVGISTNRVYWLERCLEGNNSTVYLMRAGTRVERVAVIAENIDPSNGDSVIVSKLLSSNFRATYFLKSERSGNSITEVTAYYLGFLPERESAFTAKRVPVDIAFDSDPNFEGTPVASYVCLGTQIVKYNTLNFTLSDEYSVLYNTDCTHISFYNHSLYWTSYDPTNEKYNTYFYQGSTQCDNCSAPEPLAIFSGSINDFEIGNGRIYFARPNAGIESVALNLTDLSNSQHLISQGNIMDFKLSQNRIWFNDGVNIRAINTDGSYLTTSSKINNTKTCVCSGGFSGVNCTECTRGQIQWNENKPSCVPIDPISQFPSSCIADYHCGNIPFTACNQTSASCYCATGSQGVPPLCDSCANGKQILWTNGSPSCPL